MIYFKYNTIFFNELIKYQAFAFDDCVIKLRIDSDDDDEDDGGVWKFLRWKLKRNFNWGFVVFVVVGIMLKNKINACFNFWVFIRTWCEFQVAFNVTLLLGHAINYQNHGAWVVGEGFKKYFYGLFSSFYDAAVIHECYGNHRAIKLVNNFEN